MRKTEIDSTTLLQVTIVDIILLFSSLSVVSLHAHCMQCSAVQCRRWIYYLQLCTVPVMLSTVLYCTVLYCTVQRCVVLCDVVWCGVLSYASVLRQSDTPCSTQWEECPAVVRSASNTRPTPIAFLRACVTYTARTVKIQNIFSILRIYIEFILGKKLRKHLFSYECRHNINEFIE